MTIMIDIKIEFKNPYFIADLARFNVELTTMREGKPNTLPGFWSVGDDSVEIIVLDANTVCFMINEEVKAVYYMEPRDIDLQTRQPIGMLISRHRFIERQGNVYKRHPDDQYMNKVLEFLNTWSRE